MEEAVTCFVCFKVYQQGTRDPLVLPCGHTFCRFCISAVHNTSRGNLICPTCRKDSGIVDISQLPICYPLASLSSNYNDMKFGWCRNHKEEHRFWCEECGVPLCSLCLYANHQQGHSVLPIKTVMENKKARLNKQLAHLSDEMMQGRGEIYYLYDYLTTKMKQVLSLEEKIDLLSADTDEARSVEDILECETKVKVVAEENKTWLPMKLCDIEKKLKNMKLGNVTFIENLENSESQASLQPLEGEHHDTRRMRLDYREGRLLLHSTSHPADGYLSVKMPSEVFLELGVGGICLGRVYISLWSHLRRAQQFLALCMGTMGPSYVGSCFSHVAYKGRPKETLCCREYWTESDGRGMKELLADLEWDDQYSKEPRQGLLIPLSKLIDQHGFGICTRGQTGATFPCPFGEVVSGMNVVSAAVNHHPVKEVIITHCGLVLPELSL
ncbi:E3 ubiquitin-protein ligase TRIM17-like [Portunus trituberculatus]|uniref:Zinc finger protein RFP n=1 Tax=Portunus trituberculatus TaxID=210409 RepID=A0A5B7CIE5_PORTR|nr:E3 ubiquitin-protein ligase TRIM17-like [Portunus trituberculatus]XP_045130126.1 E3 ubiquitin-protein ligase TRIM17-like [Portunus trituberculatus]XP_045130127.1 E3 ubiquitin-protein ligase TRIM17-like [Portunus trituberculatus]XP_045130128.1 E3 ubiquitin-protein ligase TRIM17-like [Portunus trituberculatus]XP_045130129.1 E3 ubiquitin-protein ligase TRIM17-like [Portunus trituberculatus]MPC08156.1 Zinc finger protein RFP [Portunus trituberculatus]